MVDRLPGRGVHFLHPIGLGQGRLKRLRLPAMGRQYKKLGQEAVKQNRPYKDYLLSLLEMEVAQRDENTQKRLVTEG